MVNFLYLIRLRNLLIYLHSKSFSHSPIFYIILSTLLVFLIKFISYKLIKYFKYFEIFLNQ